MTFSSRGLRRRYCFGDLRVAFLFFFIWRESPRRRSIMLSRRRQRPLSPRIREGAAVRPVAAPSAPSSESGVKRSSTSAGVAAGARRPHRDTMMPARVTARAMAATIRMPFRSDEDSIFRCLLSVVCCPLSVVRLSRCPTSLTRPTSLTSPTTNNGQRKTEN